MTHSSPCSYRVSFNCPPGTLQRISTCHRTLSHTLSFTQMLSILYKFHFGTAANIFPPLNKTKPQSGFTLKISAMDTCVACGLSFSSKKKNANHHCKSNHRTHALLHQENDAEKHVSSVIIIVWRSHEKAAQWNSENCCPVSEKKEIDMYLIK